MCLLVIAYRVHDDYPLIVAANRDEFHARPTQRAQWWADKPDVFGGRDLQAGGSWLALHRSGRLASVTNIRDASPEPRNPRSRGHLVTDFLESRQAPLEFLAGVRGEQYAGFNLLVSDGQELGYLSNHGGEPRRLEAGFYGLSNAMLDTPWHKVERSKSALRDLLSENRLDETGLLRLLGDRNKAPAASVQSGHLPFARAHALTAPFIVLPEYGTRCSSTVIVEKSGRWRFLERRFDADGAPRGDSKVTFEAQE